MKYIIMCGGQYKPFVSEFRPLVKINGETLVNRTIRLLREFGITDIAVSVPLDCDLLDNIGVEVLKIDNSFGFKDDVGAFTGTYADAFYITDEPATYLNGDTFYSKAAIKEIIDAETDDVIFFGTGTPFPNGYNKGMREHLGFKVVNQDKFHKGLDRFRYLQYHDWLHDVYLRFPIMWQVAQVVAGDQTDRVVETPSNFVPIYSFADDIDYDYEIKELEDVVKEYCIV